MTFMKRYSGLLLQFSHEGVDIMDVNRHVLIVHRSGGSEFIKATDVITNPYTMIFYSTLLIHQILSEKFNGVDDLKISYNPLTELQRLVDSIDGSGELREYQI
ncbi:unnamed protein product [Adineta ricciae]|uniref:Uncharacterized protein n=1 Tax=Adineta ricciae TaxID=249248 RepID=A0A813RT20_ADIRI|nr:unnamed protein product [Adineta ricciae]